MKNVAKAIELKSKLDTFRPLKKEDELRIMQKFRLDWNYHSNHLEGNSLTYGETKALLLFHITAQGKPLKDHLEVEGHNEAINLIIDIVKQERPLTESFIRELHKLLLKKTYEVDAITPEGKPTKKKVKVGEYKSTPNHVKTKTGEIFRFATPEETPAKMFDLLNWYKEKIKAKDLRPILIASEFHYRFIRIHPFDDGNGRVARILMNFILMQFGYPPVIIKTEDKVNYFAVLQLADTGNINAFIDYIALNLTHSLEIMIEGAKGKDIEEPDDLEKEVALLEQQLNSVGKTINKSKNIDNLHYLYENSIFNLFNSLIHKFKPFERFYLKTKYSLRIDDISENINNAFLKTNLRKKIDESTQRVILEIEFNFFNKKSLENFSFRSEIEFNFKFSYFNISYDDKPQLIKYYDEQLTIKEINLIVNSEVHRHKKFIKEMVEKLKE